LFVLFSECPEFIVYVTVGLISVLYIVSFVVFVMSLDRSMGSSEKYAVGNLYSVLLLLLL